MTTVGDVHSCNQVIANCPGCHRQLLLTQIRDCLRMLVVSLITDPDSDIYSKDVADSPSMMYVILAIALLCCIGQVFGGISINKKKKMGIHLVWITILISFATDILMEFTYPDYIAAQAGSKSTTVNIAFSGVCSVICGVIVAIPLMITGSGMDDSSLIG